MTSGIGSNQYWRVGQLDSMSLLKRFRLSGKDLPERQRARLKEAFEGVVNEPSVRRFLRGDNVKFDFDIDEARGLVMRFGEGPWRKVAPFSKMVGENPFGVLYREIQEVERYAKRKALGRVYGSTQREMELQPVVRRKSALRTLEGPVPYPVGQETNACAIDTGSFVRNSISALSEVVPAGAAAKMATGVAGMTIAGGAQAVAQGFLIAHKSYLRASLALDHGDNEGLGQAMLMGTSGLSYSTVGAGMVVNGSATFAKNAAVAAAGATALTVGGFVMNGTLAIWAGCGWRVTRNFRLELKEILKEPNETKRYGEALAWIRDQVSLNDFEIMEIRKTAKDPEKELMKRIQKKWDQFERRVGTDACNEVRSMLPVLERLEHGVATGQADAIQAAKSLVGEVEKGNYKERVKYKLFFLIAVIGLIGFALSLLFPPLAPVTFLICALIWFTVDSTKVHEKVAEKCWNRHLEKERHTESNSNIGICQGGAQNLGQT